MLRIYFGVLCLLLGTPLFVVSITRSDSTAPVFIFTGAVVATGAALLYPRRWLV